MLGVIFEPLRRIMSLAERDVTESIHEVHDVDARVLEAVQAIENATHSIEQHVEVIEGLATSIDPLRASVDRLGDVVEQLVVTLHPLVDAEHGIERVGRLFGHRRDRD